MDKPAHKVTYRHQQKVSLWSFLLELPNFVAVTVSAILSGSLIVWMDFVDSLGNVLNCGFVALLSYRLRRDLRYAYNYGVGKIEAISSLACNGILMCGLIFMLVSSVGDLLSPRAPSGILIYVVILKVINVACDAYFVAAQYKIKRELRTAIATTEFYTSLKSLAFDAVALVSILICWLFRDVPAAWYFSPVICIALSIWFFVGAMQRVKESVRVLTDRTLPEAEQMKIMSVLSAFHDRYADFAFLSTRMSGNTAYIDLRLRFWDDTTYREIKELCTAITAKMREQIEDCRVSIVIDGDGAEQ